jgi:hypothetical protein
VIRGLLFDKDGTLLDYEASWPPINREAGLLAAQGDAALASRLLRAAGADPATGLAVADSLLAAGNTMRTQIVIVGSGPSGLLLGQLLAGIGVDTVILERPGRGRQILAATMCSAASGPGCSNKARSACSTGRRGARLHAEGLPHGGFDCASADAPPHRRSTALTGGRHVTVYGQTEVTHDLMDKRARQGTTIYEAGKCRAARFRRRQAFRHL